MRLLAFLRWEGERHEVWVLRRGKLRVGGRRGITLPGGDLPPGFVLFRTRGRGVEISLAPGLHGVARIGGERREIDGASEKSIALRPGDLGLLRDAAWNGALIEFVCEAPAPVPSFGSRLGLERRVWGSTLAAAAVHGCVAAIVAAVGPSPRSTVHPPRLTPRIVKQQLLELREEEPEGEPEGTGTGERASRRRKAVRAAAKRQARARGVLAALKGVGSRKKTVQSLGSLFSSSLPADAVADADAAPSLGSLAAALGDGSGPGVSVAGSAKGGGGLGTRGSSMLKGSGGPSLGKRRARAVGGRVTRTPKHKVRVQGGLDRAAVLKVVNKHMVAVRNCYERALLARPSLEGKLRLEWTVGATGSVQSVRVASSTLKDQTVTNCIMGNVRKWKFPKPSRGRAVTVVFPFIFNATGY